MKKKNIKVINFQKEQEYSYKRKVIITDLVFDTLIGIHDFEKEKKQQVKFNIEIDITPLLKAVENDLKSIVNYENIISKIKLITHKKHYNLLETLAEDIFTNLFLNENIIKIKLRIEKPEIIKNTSSVGIEITKKKK
jgi:dihydroneopterin aldolase|tara:strand:- start:73 stop:483 length:411 start_codon:yes stop_codon:yes gene_type:complete